MVYTNRDKNSKIRWAGVRPATKITASVGKTSPQWVSMSGVGNPAVPFDGGDAEQWKPTRRWRSAAVLEYPSETREPATFHRFPSGPHYAHGKIGSTKVPPGGMETIRVYLQSAPRLPNLRHCTQRLRLNKHWNPHIRDAVSGVSLTTNEPRSPRRTACRARLLHASGCWLTLPYTTRME